MERLHENQVGEVLPYQYESEVGEKAASMTDQSDSEQESDSASSDDDQIDHFYCTVTNVFLKYKVGVTELIFKLI